MQMDANLRLRAVTCTRFAEEGTGTGRTNTGFARRGTDSGGRMKQGRPRKARAPNWIAKAKKFSEPRSNQPLDPGHSLFTQNANGLSSLFTPVAKPPSRQRARSIAADAGGIVRSRPAQATIGLWTLRALESWSWFMVNSTPMLLTVLEAASCLRTSRAAIYKMVERQQVPGVVRVGRRVLFDRASLVLVKSERSAVTERSSVMSVRIVRYGQSDWEVDIRWRSHGGRRQHDRKCCRARRNPQRTAGARLASATCSSMARS